MEVQPGRIHLIILAGSIRLPTNVGDNRIARACFSKAEPVMLLCA